MIIIGEFHIKGGETAGDLLQRSFARYGDKNGELSLQTFTF